MTLALDDARHGTVAGRVAGCDCRPCKAEKVRYEKIRSHEAARGRPRRIDATGTHRRIRALMAMGWTQGHIACQAGWRATKNVNDLLNHEQVLRTSAERIARAYEELSMRVGPSQPVRALATNRGYPPPLAWDDETLDDPKATPWRPTRRERRGRSHRVDEILVQRALTGQPVKANPDERQLIIEGWRKAGRSLRELDLIQGWNTRRDLREAS